MTRRALVTGGSGFVGQWLIRELLGRQWSVFSAGIAQGTVEEKVLTPEEWGLVSWLELDLRSEEQIPSVLEVSTPDVVFHLAGISFVPDAEGAPASAYDVNVLGVVRLLSEVNRRRRSGVFDPLVLVVGSAEQYGRHPVEEMPLAEEAAQRPMTAYAASKAAQEIAALQSFRREGTRVIATRSFNHSGVGQGKHFLLPALVQRAVALRGRKPSVLRIGNGDTVRDFLHVTDVVRAYMALIEGGAPGEVYNVASGDGITVRALAERVLHRLGATADIATDAALVRPVDVPVLVGASAKLRLATGWVPVRTRDDIIDDLIHAATH